MKKFLPGFLLLILFGFFLLKQNIVANIDSEINKLEQDILSLKKELETKQFNHQKLSQQLQEIKTQIDQAEQEIIKKETEVIKGEQVLKYQKKLLNERVRVYYKNVKKSSPNIFQFFFANNNLSKMIENFFYQKTLVDEDRKTILKIVLYIKKLEEKKQFLKQEKSKLSYLKTVIDKQTQILTKEILQTKEKIAALTTQQQQLIAQKLTSLNISRSANTVGRCDSDLTNGRDPGFSPKFGVFTYGVPNRVGLNQYGAKGRAESGQDFETILRSYYNFDSLQEFDSNIKINVEGYGEFSLEDYVKRIYEMPIDWPMEALKAQAVAARSYALAYTNNGTKSICATEYCQVFKPTEKGGRWNEAVDSTKGKVMIKNNQPIKAWYSSTHGGYVFSSADIGWSTTDWTKRMVDAPSSYNNFSDLNNNAYDRSSPWFYCNWGWRSQYNNTAWLRPEEITDIINVILLARYLSSEEKEHLYQVDKPNPVGKETWGIEKVKEELRKKNSQFFNQIQAVGVNVDFNNGRTTTVNFSGDGGSVSFDGSEFKNWFNLRAPANIQIVGPLYNFEKR